MSRGGGRYSRMLTVDMAPMIDVVFLLIIFFMTTAQAARLTRAEIDLPQEQGEQEEPAEEAGLIVNLQVDGSLIVGSRTVTYAELEAVVREEIRNTSDGTAATVKLLIRADRNADTAHLNRLVTALQDLGVGVARVATEVPR